MKLGKLIVFLVLVSAIVVFNFLFKDKLIERGLEAGLQSVFQARAEVTDLTFQLLKARIRFLHLQVANKDAPMKNLFELGPTEVDLSLAELLKKKFVIENITCREIRWNTDRQSSGALETAEQAGKEPEKGEGKKKILLPDKLSTLLNFKATQLIEEQKDKLKSFGKIDEVNASINESTDRWETTLRDMNKDFDTVSKGIAAVTKIDFGSLKSVGEVQEAYTQVEVLAPLVNRLHGDVDRVNSGIREDLKTINREIKGISGLIEQDSSYLKGLVRLPEGGLKGLMSSLVQNYLQQKLGRLYGVAMKAKIAALNMREKRKEKKKMTARGRGEDIPFPTTIYPKFLLKHFGLSMSQDPYTVSADAWDISSNPDLWNKPAGFEVTYAEGPRKVLASGTVDSRSKAEQPLRLSLEASNFPFELNNPDLLKMRYLRGTYQMDSTLVMDREDQTTGTVRIRILSLEMDAGGTQDLITRIVYDTLRASSDINLDVDFRVTQPGNTFSLSVRSNLDDAISRQLGKEAGTLVQQYQAQLIEELHLRLAPELEKNKTLLGSFKDVQSAGLQDKARLNGYTKQLAAKQEEFKQALLKLGGSKTLQDAVKKLKLP